MKIKHIIGTAILSASTVMVGVAPAGAATNSTKSVTQQISTAFADRPVSRSFAATPGKVCITPTKGDAEDWWTVRLERRTTTGAGSTRFRPVAGSIREIQGRGAAKCVTVGEAGTYRVRFASTDRRYRPTGTFRITYAG